MNYDDNKLVKAFKNNSKFTLCIFLLLEIIFNNLLVTINYNNN